MVNLRRELLVAGFLLLCVVRSATGSPQSGGEFFPSEVDTTYIENFKYKLTARYYLLAQNTSLMIYPDKESSLLYQPNESGRIGIAGFYSWFGLGLSLGTKLFRRNPDVYGTTRSWDFRVNAYGKFLAVEGYLQYYRGFYMNYKYDDTRETVIIPGMSLISFGVDGTYIYNYGKFSIRAAFTQNERQKKSAGSLVVKPTFRYYYVDSDTGIIPQNVLDIYAPGQKNILCGNFYTLGLGPGYIYTFVFLKNFYITAATQLDMNWSFYDYRTPDESHNYRGFSFPFSIRAVAGYNSNTWFIGTSFISTVFVLRPGALDRNEFHYSLTQIRFWVGTRFNVFKRWNKKKS